jgi:D-alanyl-D-alanine endopeptidase (penicillin-binding protein 7)
VRATQRVFALGVAAALLLAAGPLSAAPQVRTSSAPKKPAAKPGGKPAPQKAVVIPAKTPSRTSLARAAAAARARRAAAQRSQAARSQQQAMTAHFKRDVLGNLVPLVRAAAAIIYDPQTGEVLWEENARDQRSIASLTKIMTAVTFMADDPDLTQRVTVTSADTRAASVTYLRTGDVLSYRDVLHLTLIASDNAGARVLARTSEGGTAGFVARMNDMARALGLVSTHYEEPSGLNSQNVSSAFDMSHLISFAAGDDRLGPIMRLSEYEAQTGTRPIKIHSTNKLLGTDVDVRGGKTGFISKAGYCLATLLQVPQGSPVAVVVLGASTSTLRFWEARHLFNWVVGRAQGIVGGEPAAAK